MFDSGFGAAVIVVGSITLQVLFSVLVLLRPRRTQSSSFAWILIIVTLPGVGIILFILFGELRSGSARKRRHAEIQTMVRPALARAWATSPPGVVSVQFARSFPDP